MITVSYNSRSPLNSESGSGSLSPSTLMTNHLDAKNVDFQIQWMQPRNFGILLATVEALRDVFPQPLHLLRIGGLHELVNQHTQFIRRELTDFCKLFRVMHDLRQLRRRQAINLVDKLGSCHRLTILEVPRSVNLGEGTEGTGLREEPRAFRLRTPDVRGNRMSRRRRSEFRL